MTIAKALVGLIMSLLFIVNHLFGVDIGIDETLVTTLVDVAIGLLGTFGIYQVSNAPE